MRVIRCMTIVLAVAAGVATGVAGGNKKDEGASFKTGVLPLFQRSCLPCHAEGSSNPSELILDSRELLLKGGKAGPSVIPGNSKGSILIQKLAATPPFGDRMPLKRRRDPRDLSLTQEEINLIADWIDHGARDN
jgi:hypothetical protein